MEDIAFVVSWSHAFSRYVALSELESRTSYGCNKIGKIWILWQIWTRVNHGICLWKIWILWQIYTRKPWYLMELNEYTRLSVSFFFSLWLTGSVTAHEVFIVVRKSKKMYLYVARDFKIRASFVVNIPSQHWSKEWTLLSGHCSQLWTLLSPNYFWISWYEGLSFRRTSWCRTCKELKKGHTHIFPLIHIIWQKEIAGKQTGNWQ